MEIFKNSVKYNIYLVFWHPMQGYGFLNSQILRPSLRVASTPNRTKTTRIARIIYTN